MMKRISNQAPAGSAHDRGRSPSAARSLRPRCRSRARGRCRRRSTAERIAKVMARVGLASRREAEAWIEAGRVSVNGNKDHLAGVERHRS